MFTELDQLTPWRGGTELVYKSVALPNEGDQAVY